MLATQRDAQGCLSHAVKIGFSFSILGSTSHEKPPQTDDGHILVVSETVECFVDFRVTRREKMRGLRDEIDCLELGGAAVLLCKDGYKIY